MISEKQLAANRRNAQRSTGPRSDAGKKRVSLNGLRHGLAGQATVLSTDDRNAHDRFCADIVSDYKPETALERQLAAIIAEEYWRLNRIGAVETNIFALAVIESETVISDNPELDANPEIAAALATARAFRDETRQFELLSIYEQRIFRTVHKNLKRLRELQEERKACPPPQNGFGFANSV